MKNFKGKVTFISIGGGPDAQRPLAHCHLDAEAAGPIYLNRADFQPRH